jgi:hypothetical protein
VGHVHRSWGRSFDASYLSFFVKEPKELLFVAALPWSANPTLWIGMAYLISGRFRAAICSSVLALLFGLSIKLSSWEYFGVATIDKDTLEATCSPAYYTWLSSMALLLFSGVMGYWMAKRKQRETSNP